MRDRSRSGSGRRRQSSAVDLTRHGIRRLVAILLAVADEHVKTIDCGSPAADLATLNCQRQTSGDRCRKGARAARVTRSSSCAGSGGGFIGRQMCTTASLLPGRRAVLRMVLDRLRCEFFGWARFALGSFPLGQTESRSVLAETPSDRQCLIERSDLVSDVVRRRSFFPSRSERRQGRFASGSCRSTIGPDGAAPRCSL